MSKAKSKTHPAIKSITSTDHVTTELATQTPPATEAPGAGVFEPVCHDLICSDLNNPRKTFDDDGLAELAASIVRDGLVEPIVLRPDPGDAGRYMLIAGERRWRAIGQAIFAGGWPAERPIPAMIRTVDEHDARRLALVENLQRRDLNAVEEARALQQLAELTGASAADIGRDLGFTPRWAQQRLQLLQLPPALQDQVETRKITVEQARTVLAILPKLPPIKIAELEAGKITVADAKAWLDQQPEPLSDAARLAFMELIEKCKAEPFKAGSYMATKIAGATVRRDQGDNGVRMSIEVEDPNGALAELRKRQLCEEPRRVRIEDVETGEHYVSLGYYGEHYMGPQLFKWAFDAKFRETAIPTLRVQVYGLQVDAAAQAGGGFATPWLNDEVVKLAPEILAEIRANKEAREATEQLWKDQQAEQAQASLDRQRAAKERLAAAAMVEPELRQAFAVNAGAFTGSIQGKAADLGISFPLFMSDDGEIIDASGAELIDGVYHERDRSLPMRRLLVAALNVAAGVETPTEQPVPMDADAMPRADFLAATARHLTAADDTLTPDAATAKAERGLEAMLAGEGWIYGEADALDWDDNGAQSLAGYISDDGLGEPKACEDDTGGEGSDAAPALESVG
jgi:ParB family chromosome partitioning protein